VPTPAGRRALSRLPIRVTLPDRTGFGAGGPDAPVLTLVRPADFYRILDLA
jgi:cyclopropane-fatty-acyl-phospholipid synthase